MDGASASAPMSPRVEYEAGPLAVLVPAGRCITRGTLRLWQARPLILRPSMQAATRQEQLRHVQKRGDSAAIAKEHPIEPWW